MKTVIAIREECHGFIGIAEDMESAFDFLLKEKWITETTDFCLNYGIEEEEDFLSLKEIMIKYEFDSLLETLLFFWNNEGDAFFEGVVYFDEETIYKREED